MKQCLRKLLQRLDKLKQRKREAKSHFGDFFVPLPAVK
jgi:hypothetical protein